MAFAGSYPTAALAVAGDTVLGVQSGAVVEFPATPAVANLTALRLLASPKQSMIYLLGYATTGDGGEGWWRYDPSDSTTADNAGTVVVATAARWKRVYTGPASVRWFGAVGNGTTDDGPRIQAAVTALGGVAYTFGDGYTYKVSTVVNVTSAAANASFVGASNIICGAADVFMMYVTASGVRIDGVKMTNPTGYGQTNRLLSSTSGAILIALQVSGCSVTNCDIENFIVGIWHQGYDGSHPVAGSRFAGNRISVLPWDMTCGTFTATISSTNMTVSAVASGQVVVFNDLTGPGIATGTTISSQSSGTPGGVGVYVLNIAHTVAAPTTLFCRATWTNDGITTSNSAQGDVIEGNTIVIYSGAGIFTNFTTAYTFARCGITVDAGVIETTVRNNTVGRGFRVTFYNDGTNTGVAVENNTFYQGQNSTASITSALARNNTIYGSLNTETTSVLTGSVLISGGGRLVDSRIIGSLSTVNAVHVLNTGSDRIEVMDNVFSGSYAAGVFGNFPSNFCAARNDWAGTCAGNLYDVGMVSSAGTASWSGDTQRSGLTYGSALNCNPVYAATITGNNWGGATNTNINLLGGVAMSITITGNRLTNSHPAQASLLVSNGATVPKITFVANDCTGLTTAVLINAAAASIGTAQIVASNVNNTSGTF